MKWKNWLEIWNILSILLEHGIQVRYTCLFSTIQESFRAKKQQQKTKLSSKPTPVWPDIIQLWSASSTTVPRSCHAWTVVKQLDLQVQEFEVNDSTVIHQPNQKSWFLGIIKILKGEVRTLTTNYDFEKIVVACDVRTQHSSASVRFSEGQTFWLFPPKKCGENLHHSPWKMVVGRWSFPIGAR